jgi:hypothetical protein
VSQAAVSITLTLECWRFVDEARSWPVLVPLPSDVHAILNRTPHIEIRGPIPEPHFAYR